MPGGRRGRRVRDTGLPASRQMSGRSGAGETGNCVVWSLVTACREIRVGDRIRSGPLSPSKRGEG
jgi:hypothetical protein